MKRIAIVFALGILAPALALGFLAFGSIADQKAATERQRALALQATCESLSADINLFFDDLRLFHAETVDELAADWGDELPGRFDEAITGVWIQAALGVAVSDDGRVLVPTTRELTGDEISFLDRNGDFLASREEVEVYQAPRLLNEQLQVSSEMAAADEPIRSSSFEGLPGRKKVSATLNRVQDSRFDQPTASRTAATESEISETAEIASAPAAASAPKWEVRNVAPAQQLSAPNSTTAQLDGDASGDFSWSAVESKRARSSELIDDQEEGAVSRFIDGELQILLWSKPRSLPGYTFWTLLDLASIRNDLSVLFETETIPRPEEAAFVLLDGDTTPVASSRSDFAAEWSRPFVASEIGPILPRWEVASYLVDPGALDAASRTTRLLLSLLVLVLLGSVAFGTFLVLRSIDYELRLASRKTDFVGNVSHELKTPLTSIRMFSELLSDPSERDPATVHRYAGIVAKESARLSRLIERLLDFSRLDRGEGKLRREAVDLGEVVRDTLDAYRPMNGETSFATQPTNFPRALVHGDRDALAQILLNLVSNAEKYGGNAEEISIEVFADAAEAGFSVHDRGPGIPKRHRRKIFEKFYRADDSIDSGVDGSGIGLALCRQIAAQHGGSVEHRPRPGGGSTFTFRMPCGNRTDES